MMKSTAPSRVPHGNGTTRKAVAFALLSLLQPSFATSGMIDELITTEYVDLQIKPDSRHIQYIEVRLDAPGYIDLSELKFSTVNTGHDPDDLQDFLAEEEEEEMDDAILWDDDWSHTASPKKTTQVDVAIVYIPDDCPAVDDKESPHCDFSEVGVGRKHSEVLGLLDEPYWCCTDEEVQLEICDGSVASYGRMMMNLTTFEGSHRFVDVPPYGEITQSLKYAKIEEVEHSGKYAVIIANCYKEAGRDIVMQGDLKVKSSGSQTPFNTAMKSFAKKSVERAEENQMQKDEGSSGLGLTFVILVVGIVGVAFILRDNVGRLGMAMTRGYNTLELSEMDGQASNENNYVPISPSW